MILAELKAYLIARGPTAMPDLVAHFGTSAEALRGMLEHWTRKGRVRRLETETACGQCHKCAESAVETYAWTGRSRVDEDRAETEAAT